MNAPQIRLGWGRRIVEDLRAEFRHEFGPVVKRTGRFLRRLNNRIDGRLFAWMADAEPSHSPSLRLLAEDDQGYMLMPAGIRNGEPWWEGRWCWYRPDHWPVYVRTTCARSYVMVESQ